MQALTVTQGKIHQTKYGALPHADMIGRKFGTKLITLIKNIFVSQGHSQATNTQHKHILLSFSFFMTIAY